ncbi:anti-sigma factor family protein [Phytoactinopolyspora halotolerans]|uniref:Anti-sigma factor n=1 Tax=Phytoactinopolyspora halotolerans TaxID=1981512 RepID=A0A6L9S695_9ACTN|nr:zf-HC2 domain-containing protein [Phytoactinopolyspora halotolerans]NEE00676.1 anti-sigma factor [Phytoactinopolyspora halotolerans]
MTGTEITSCTEALRLLAAYLDTELEEHEHGEMERHLQRCRSCYSRAEFEAHLKASIAELAHEPVPPRLSARVHTLIREFTVAGDR